jgi:hypothetical protein
MTSSATAEVLDKRVERLQSELNRLKTKGGVRWCVDCCFRVCVICGLGWLVLVIEADFWGGKGFFFFKRALWHVARPGISRLKRRKRKFDQSQGTRRGKFSHRLMTRPSVSKKPSRRGAKRVTKTTPPLPHPRRTSRRSTRASSPRSSSSSWSPARTGAPRSATCSPRPSGSPSSRSTSGRCFVSRGALVWGLLPRGACCGCSCVAVSSVGPLRWWGTICHGEDVSIRRSALGNVWQDGFFVGCMRGFLSERQRVDAVIF